MLFDVIKSIIKKNSEHKTFIHGSAFAIFSFVNRGISFLLLLMLANYIKPYEYGMLSMYTTVVELISYFMAFSTAGYISIAFFNKKKSEFRKDFTCVVFLEIISALILAIILCFGGESFSEVLNLPSVYIWISLCVCFLTQFHNINVDLFRIKSNIKWFGVLSCGYAVLNFFLSLILVIECDLKWEGRIYAHLISTLCFFIIALIIFCKRDLLVFSLEWKRIKTILIWGVPLIPHLTSNWIKSGFDRMIINHNYTMDDVGIFSFALNMTTLITMIGFGFNQAYSVDIYKILSNKEYSLSVLSFNIRKQRHRMLYIYILLYILIFFSCVFFIPLLFPEYSKSLIYFVPLSLYGLGVCVYLLYCNYLFYYGKNKIIMYTTFGSSIIHLVLSSLLTKYSLIYTAVIYIISQILIVLIIKHYSNKTIKEKLRTI